MMLKKLFLAHHSGDASEVKELATELRLHGILPWLDKDGGFSIADHAEREADRAILEDCFGLLLYATSRAFDRPFIRDVEMKAALRAHETDPTFALFAVPRGISFRRLREESLRSFGVDLSEFHSKPIQRGPVDEAIWASIASAVLERRLRHNSLPRPSPWLSLQFSTREVLPPEPLDALCIDATTLFRAGVDRPSDWDRLVRALRHTKEHLSSIHGRPRLSVHGSKHLAAAFIFGRVFAHFHMEIRQTRDQIWRSDASFEDSSPLAVSSVEGNPGDTRLFLEVASGYKNVSSGVDAILMALDRADPPRLRLLPRYGRLDVDNALCIAMVRQVYWELERTLQVRPCSEIHLFAAVPQSFMMLLGREFKGMPPVHLYEWDSDTNRYVHACTIQGGIL